MVLPAAAVAILLFLVLMLHLLTRRRLNGLRDEVERQRRLLEVINERQHGPPPPSPPLPPPLPSSRPPTARFTPRGTQRLADPSPHANKRLPEPSPRSSTALGDISRGVPRLPDPSPRGSPRLPDISPRGTTSLPDTRPVGGGWSPTHRITFTPDHGRPESWLVMVTAGPAGGRMAMTKAEWSANVDPAWHCGANGMWTYRGQRTPEGARGAVNIEEFRA